MAEEKSGSLEYTPTWVVAFICFIIVLLSLLAERGLHHLGKVYITLSLSVKIFQVFSKLSSFFVFPSVWSVDGKMPCSRPCRNLKKVPSSFSAISNMLRLFDFNHTWLSDKVDVFTELMLLGFISLLLTVSQTSIRHICVPAALVNNMFPCKKQLEKHRAPESAHSLINARHLLATGESLDSCAAKAIFFLFPENS